MKYAIYIRAARKEKMEDGANTYQQQRSALEAYAKEKGLEVVEQYYDLGYSGNSADRPGLRSLIEGYAVGRFDAVLTIDLGHLSRKAIPFPFVVETLKA